MSKTDKTRPWWVQARDLTEDGYVIRACTHGTECENGPTCGRILRHYGGERYLGGHVSAECSRRRRQIRHRARRALHRVLTQEVAEEDFDILPIREDNRTIYDDLT